MTVNKLRQITLKALEWLEQEYPDEFDFDVDYYWHISGKDLYNLDADPVEFTMGQLSDEWNELQDLKNKNRIPSRVDLVWLSGIFRAFGEGKAISFPFKQNAKN